MSNLPPDDDAGTGRDPVSPTEREAMNARQTSPREILLLLMLLLVLLLIAVATGRGMLIRFSESNGPGGSAPLPTRIPVGQASTSPATRGQLAVADAALPARGAPAVCSPPGAAQRISPLFRPYYDQHGRVQTFGLPISPEINDNGHVFQWFERGRLEHHPEHAGTQHEIQGGLVGVEFTKGIPFPRQTFFVSQPGVRYFGETGHGVRDPFLSFWEQNGGLEIFGYPISDEVTERLPEDKQPHIVQYFERVRLEYHPGQPNAPVQVGLLGRARCLEKSKPDILASTQPTPLPMP